MEGVGIDIIEISRFRQLLDKKPSLLRRLFTEYEWNYADQKQKAQTLAGLWCAKEAVLKAMSLYISDLNITDVCLAHHPNGAPYVFSIKNRDISQFDMSISISHSSLTATVVCIFSKNASQ